MYIINILLNDFMKATRIIYDYNYYMNSVYDFTIVQKLNFISYFVQNVFIRHGTSCASIA